MFCYYTMRTYSKEEPGKLITRSLLIFPPKPGVPLLKDFLGFPCSSGNYLDVISQSETAWRIAVMTNYMDISQLESLC